MAIATTNGPDEVAVKHDLPRQRLLIVDHP